MSTTIMGVNTVSAASTAMFQPLYINSYCNNRTSCSITTNNNNNNNNQPRLQQQIADLKLEQFGTTRIKTLSFSRQFAPQFRKIGHTVTCNAIEQSQSTFQGVYGPWTIESSDIREVILYRCGLVTAALSFVLASSTTFLPENFSFGETLVQNLDLFYLLGSAGLGMSLFLIHIYVTEIKRTLQALWALGAIGSLVTYTALAQPAGEGLVQYVVDHPSAVWLVGPVFAALTGLVFKEGLCYGKLEAAILTIIIPITLLGHLSGLMDDVAKSTLLGVWMTLFIIFAGRKFTQPVKDDIGDKSVFIYNALSEEEKAALLEKIEQQRR